jgi:hypothetical protein
MPQLVNGDYSTEAAKKGATIDVPIPSARAATDVTPSNTPPTPADTTPEVVQIPLDNWKKVNFHLTDKDLVEIDKNEHFLPMEVGEAIRALANSINLSVLMEYVGVYGMAGTPGTDPFLSDASEMIAARKILHSQLCPRDMRRCVLDFDAEANALALSTFADANRTADAGQVKREGEVGRKYGFDIYTDDQIPNHTAGTASGATTDATGYAAGLKTVTLASAGTGTIVEGDVITFAGDSQQYAVTSGDADVSGGGTISFQPGLKQAIPTSATAITVAGDHTVNLAFHRDAFALAMRPLREETQQLALGSEIVASQDPQTGLTLRLEISRQYKQVVWEFDALWGVKLVRPELACRIAGQV